MKDSDIKKGVFFAFLTAVISGVAIFYSKISLIKIPPLVLTSGRNSWVALLFVVIFFWGGQWGQLRKLKRKELVLLILIGLVGGSLPFYLFFTGLQFTQAITANLIHKSLFIWVIILAVVFLKEKLSLSYLTAFILVFLANFYFAKLPVSFGKGELMVLTATLFWSVENVLAKKVLKTVSSELVGFFRMAIGSLILILSLILSGSFHKLVSLNQQQLTTVLIGGTILFFYVFCWYKALKYAPASLVTLILTFSVVVGNLLNGSFAGVKFIQKDINSSLLITAAVFLMLFANLGLLRILKLKSKNK